jgi:general secretion pathway protein K
VNAGRRPQRGVALITALLVVAIATVAAVTMASRQQLDIRRTAGLLHGEQAWAYALGAENWARVVLRRDARNNRIDTLEEDWSTQPPVSFVEGGSIVGRLIDLQGRFNLNNLVQQNGAVDAKALVFYKRLLRRLDLDERLADALVDWIDPDINVRFPDGAEDETYLLVDPPYRTANRPLVDSSELRLVRGYTAEVVAALQAHVVALPTHTAINVNTADATVLSAVAEGLSQVDGEALVEARGEGFKDLAGFLSQAPLAGKRVEADLLDVRTDWFLLLTEINIGQARVRLASRILRLRDQLYVVSRQREFPESVVPRVEEAEPAP